MAIINKIIHRFIRPRSDYMNPTKELYNQIIPYNVQAYSYELKPNGDPTKPDDYIVRYVLGTGKSTYQQIADGLGKDIDGNPVPELSKEFMLTSSTQLTDIIINDLSSKVDKTTIPSKIYGTDDLGNQTIYDISAITGGVADVMLNGTSVVSNNIARLNLKAGDSTYNNDAVPSINNVQQALDNLMNIHYYINPAYTTFNVDRSGNYDVGTTLSQPFTITWALNKQPEAGDTQTLKLDSNILLDIMSLSDQSKWKAGSYTYNSNITSNTVKTYTFRIDYRDNHSTIPSGKTNICSATRTFNFMYRRYWGVTSTTTLSDAQLLALSNELSTTRVQERDFNCTGGKYWWFVIPAIYCNGITFTDVGSGLPMTLPPECISTRTITNSQGISYDVNVYRGEFIQTASSVKIKVN